MATRAETGLAPKHLLSGAERGITTPRFAESMLENFDDDVVQRACDIVVGAVGAARVDTFLQN